MLNEVNILESPNEYYQKQVKKNGSKKTLCPALAKRTLYNNSGLFRAIVMKRSYFCFIAPFRVMDLIFPPKKLG